MPQTFSWIVVTDASRGRILVQERLGAPLRRAFDEEDLVAPGSDRPVRDRPGRLALEPRADPHEKAEREMCEFVADIVNRAAQDGRFQRLIVVAPPQFLGELRRALSPRARALVSAEVAKNLVRLEDAEIAAHLGSALLSPLATVRSEL